MSCCGGNCGCGSNCMCGNCSGGCGKYMYSDIEKATSTPTIIDGIAPKTMYAKGPAKKSFGAEGGHAPAGLPTVDDKMEL